MKNRIGRHILAWLLALPLAAQAAFIQSESYVFQVDGLIADSVLFDPADPGSLLASDLGVSLDESLFDPFNPVDCEVIDCLTQASLQITDAGSHTVIGMFDYTLFDPTFPFGVSFFDEFGQANGTPAAGQSWEIDEPGLAFGDIVDNVVLGSLDNTNALPNGSEEDLSFALGWDFSLLPGDVADISFVLTDVQPEPTSVDFFLAQFDNPDGLTDPPFGDAIYYYSTLNITSTGGPPGPPAPPPLVSVPSPAPLALIAPLLLGLGVREVLRRRGARHQPA